MVMFFSHYYSLYRSSHLCSAIYSRRSIKQLKREIKARMDARADVKGLSGSDNEDEAPYNKVLTTMHVPADFLDRHQSVA